MTRLMVLGGGRHQVPLIQRAEQRNIEVVLIDYLSDAPGRDMATYSELADATDAEAAIGFAKTYSVDGVITTGTDIPIRAMAAAAEALDLPHYLTPDSAYKATDKEAMFKALRAIGVPMAKRVIVDDDQTPHVKALPVVVKPADSQGQRGITLVTRTDQVPAAIASAREASKSRRAVVEEYLPGPEFTANAWIHDGQLELLMVNDRVTFNPSPFLGVAFQHRYPSRAASAWVGDVESITRKIAKAYGLERGPLYIQMIATESGPVVVEAAARIGGGHESRLLLHLNGWSTDDALIDIALGEPGSTPPGLPEDAHALVNFILGSSGTVGRLIEPELAEGISEAAWYVRPGTQLDDVTNSLGRVGYFIAEATSSAQLTEVSAAFYNTLELPSTEGGNLVHVPDPAVLNSP